MAEYILHDGINEQDEELRYASARAMAIGSSHMSSLMLGASDDLEIPLISNDNHSHQNGSMGGGGSSSSSDCCLFGQKGFRPAHSEYTSNKKAKQQLIVATVICFLFMIAELIGGLMAGSLAVVTDAAHLLTDCIGFIVAMVAISLSKKLPDRRMTFGYKRFEVLGAVISVLGIWLLTGILVYLAVLRVIDQNFDIDADTMIIISTIGVGINIVMASVLHGNCLNVTLPHGHGHSHGGHGHSHSHNKPCKSSGQVTTLSAGQGGHLPRKDDVAVLAHGVINMHSTSIHTTHSRHNSFSKTLPNGGNLLDTSEMNVTSAVAVGAGSGDKAFARLNLDHSHHNHPQSHSPSHKHHQQNGSYTLLSMNNINEDGLIVDSHMQQLNGCDSDEEDEGHVHCGGAHGDAEEDSELGSDLKLGQLQESEVPGNLNIRAAMIHVIGDFVQSIGVLISAVVIKFYPDAKLIDPACTFVFSVIVFFTTIKIMKESLAVLLDATPLSINLAKLEKELRCVDGVRSLHHLNVFGVSVDWNVMTVHLVIDNMTSGDEVVRTVSQLVKRGYNIKHVTVQIERQKLKLAMSSPNGHHHHHLNSIQGGGNELI